MARRRGGIRIVWLAWFSDSIALWQRQDETPYLLDPSHPPLSHGPGPDTTMTNAGTGADSGLRGGEHDLDADEDWDQGPPGIKETGTLELGSINWDDINDEVEAAMNESDDEDGDGDGDAKSERSYDMQSGHVSEEEWPDGNSISGSVVLNISLLPFLHNQRSFVRAAPNNSQLSPRKRPRSETPGPEEMRGPVNGNTDDDDLRSPLAKRKRLLSERSVSRLKQGFLAEDLAQSEAETASNGSASASETPAAAAPATDPQEMEQEEEEEEEEEDEHEGDKEEEDDDDDSTDSDDSSDEEEEEEDDDFLTRALEEDMR
jgi:RNA polymerase II subunit A-like phosphatase